MNDSPVERGRQGETLAVNHLTENGYKILLRNFRTRRGEVDIVCVDATTVVFVEVKSYRSLPSEVLEYAVDKKKQQRISVAARGFLASHPQLADWSTRFDVVYVNLSDGSIKHIPDAFET